MVRTENLQNMAETLDFIERVKTEMQIPSGVLQNINWNHFFIWLVKTSINSFPPLIALLLSEHLTSWCPNYISAILIITTVYLMNLLSLLACFIIIALLNLSSSLSIILLIFRLCTDCFCIVTLRIISSKKGMQMPADIRCFSILQYPRIGLTHFHVLLALPGFF